MADGLDADRRAARSRRRDHRPARTGRPASRSGRMRVPLGVVGIIYESRPNVTADAAGLCLKAGNATILRGGSEAMRSNQAIAACVHEGLRAAGLPETAVQVVATTDRAAVGHLIADEKHVDVIVPRGGKSLIERIAREAKVPVIKHLDGVCHVYVDAAADVDDGDPHRRQREDAALFAVQHDGDAARARRHRRARAAAAGDDLRGEGRRAARLRARARARAGDEGRDRGRLVRRIPGADPRGARRRRARRRRSRTSRKYGSQHTDAIVTEDYADAMRFLREVDSSSVMVNASTRFADGFEYGLGAEIGISTNKLHARGPVGLEGLTSQKWIVLGSGQIRERRRPDAVGRSGIVPMRVPRESSSLTSSMSSSVSVSIATNTAIAAAKGFGWFVTGSPTLFAETIHSLADVGNQVLLKIGEVRGRGGPTRDASVRPRPGEVLLGAGLRGQRVLHRLRHQRLPRRFTRCSTRRTVEPFTPLVVGLLLFALALESWTFVDRAGRRSAAARGLARKPQQRDRARRAARGRRRAARHPADAAGRRRVVRRGPAARIRRGGRHRRRRAAGRDGAVPRGAQSPAADRQRRTRRSTAPPRRGSAQQRRPRRGALAHGRRRPRGRVRPRAARSAGFATRSARR